jgi:hypothetical protein
MGLAANAQSGTAQNQPTTSDSKTQRVEVVSVPGDNLPVITAVINGILALVAGATLLFIWGQAESAKEAAIAARTSADAYKKRERAWLLANPTEWDPNTNFAGPNEANIHRTVPIAIKNVGSSPARIESICAGFLVLDSLDDLPFEPAYKRVEQYGSMLLAPGDSISHLADLETAAEEPMLHLFEGQKLLFVQTRVNYLDIYGSEHETNSGRLYDFSVIGVFGISKPRIRPAGPAAYNVCT